MEQWRRGKAVDNGRGVEGRNKQAMLESESVYENNTLFMLNNDIAICQLET